MSRAHPWLLLAVRCLIKYPLHEPKLYHLVIRIILGWDLISPLSSVDSTFTLFDVVEDTGSNLERILYRNALARVPLKTYFPGPPGFETRRVG